MVTAPTQKVPMVTWPTPAPILYGEVLSKKQLGATANVPGSFTYSPASGTVLSAGSHKLTVTFKPSGSGFSPVTASVTIQVQQATPIIGWLPLPLFSGSPLGLLQLDAFALDPTRFGLPLPGKFVYSPPAGTVLSIGWHKLTATFTPANASFKTVTVAVEVDVLKRPGSDR
jgi:hypothetical protein